ncbi:T9SS type A sorting domain-containing protein [Winogradskyella sp. A3E31]|uniref:T9SS type A sorting domain-containing protein n=1 Tax=Winogradskyella sp. A3E31 TaxID=3349637 RepID=UPI00398AFECB
MKTRLLLSVLLLLSFNFVFSQTFVPDDIFEAFLEANGMGNGVANDNFVTTSNINSVTTLDVSGLGIESMEGIEDFAALEILDCSSNNFLPSLNVFNNTALIELRAFNCDLNSLTLPNNNLLTFLSIGNNHLSGLDVSAYPDLDFLSCANNFNINIGTLDLSSNPNLTTLYCQNAGVSSLDISQCTNLDLLVCYNNPLSSLDISANTALSEVRCYSSLNNTLTISNSTYPNMTYFDCSDNGLNSLDVTVFPNLTALYCANNDLSSINVSTLTDLVDFGLWNNNLTSLDVSNNLVLEYVEPGNNPNLTSLMLPNTTTLSQVWAYGASLSTLDYTNNTGLQFLDIGINNFTSADVSMLPNLLQFYCNQNQLTYLNIANGNNAALDWMWAHDNPSLNCIQVDDVALAGTKSSPNWQRDPGANFSLSCSLSTNDNAILAFNLYPNPTEGNVHIETDYDIDYQLISLQGGSVLSGSFTKGLNEFSTSSISSGLYLLKVKSGIETITKKLIIK